jgi:single-strand selective monofunctional uracil DNA glycosylase
MVLLLLMPSLINTVSRLSAELAKLEFFPPVTHIYDPTSYAREPLAAYFEKFGQAPKRIVLVGMNPGPWGMLQTGVPFGEVGIVRDWMGIEGQVGQPGHLHPKRPVEGFACTRSEVSGSRLWGWARDRFGSAEGFFRDFLVVNYCPLAFFDCGGKNITPDKLKKADRDQIYRLCDGATERMVKVLKPEWVIGVGRFAYERCAVALEGIDVKVGRVTHPSPANPAANRDWVSLIEAELAETGVDLP